MQHTHTYMYTMYGHTTIVCVHLQPGGCVDEHEDTDEDDHNVADCPSPTLHLLQIKDIHQHAGYHHKKSHQHTPTYQKDLASQLQGETEKLFSKILTLDHQKSSLKYVIDVICTLFRIVRCACTVREVSKEVISRLL